MASVIVKHKTVIIDGYIGVFYDQFREKLNEQFEYIGMKPAWTDASHFLKPPYQISEMISPFTGGDDPVFGKRTTLNLDDFFDLPGLQKLSPVPEADINLIIGPGAALSGWEGFLIYIDISKNEIQYRSGAGSISNLGAASPADPKSMYKQFYFVDWVVLNKHKRNILPRRRHITSSILKIMLLYILAFRKILFQINFNKTLKSVIKNLSLLILKRIYRNILHQNMICS